MSILCVPLFTLQYFTSYKSWCAGGPSYILFPFFNPNNHDVPHNTHTNPWCTPEKQSKPIIYPVYPYYPMGFSIMVFKQSFVRRRGISWHFLPKPGTHLNETNHYQIATFHENQRLLWEGHSTIATPSSVCWRNDGWWYCFLDDSPSLFSPGCPMTWRNHLVSHHCFGQGNFPVVWVGSFS